MSDDAANKFKRKGESIRNFKIRLYNTWVGMTNDLMQSAVPTVRLSSRLGTGITRGSVGDFLLRPTIFKFGNIANSQWDGVKKNVAC